MERSILSGGNAFWKRVTATKRKPKSKSQKVMEVLMLTLLLAYLLLLSFPQMVFARSVTYHNFRVYSTAPIDGSIYPVLDKAEQKLAGSDDQRPPRFLPHLPLPQPQSPLPSSRRRPARRLPTTCLSSTTSS